MINLFQIAVNDRSIDYLANIFGHMGGVIPGTSSGLPVTLLGTLFKTFNSIVLAVAALIIVYTTVVGVMMTAHEGEFMKKWNSLWTPIRMVIGIASLVPTPSGFCGLQIIMMWIIVQGVGAADTLWTTGLAYINVVGSPYSEVEMPGLDAEDNITSLFQGLVCQEATNQANGLATDADYKFYKKDYTAIPFNTSKIANSNKKTLAYDMGPNGDCGTLTYCNPNAYCDNGKDVESDGSEMSSKQIACNACHAQITALGSIINEVLTPVAIDLVKTDYQFLDFYSTNVDDDPPEYSFIRNYTDANNLKYIAYKTKSVNIGFQTVDVPIEKTKGGVTLDPKMGARGPSKALVRDLYWPYAISQTVDNTDFIQTSVDQYKAVIGEAVNQYIQNSMNNPTAMKQQLRDAQETGWIFAGGYYAALAKQQNQNFEGSIPFIDVNSDYQAGTDDNKLYKGKYRTDYQAAKWISMLSTGDMDMDNVNASGALKKTGSLASKALKPVAKGLFKATKVNNTNPLMALQATGIGMLYAAQVLYVASSTFWAAATALMQVPSVLVAGSGYAINPGMAFLGVLFIIFMPIVLALEGFLITFGGMLAVYLPLIPYVIFAFGVIAWFLSVMEAMVAGPLIALGIITPSQHGHELLGKADRALMLIFHIFLRPSLMIFGFFAAMLLASAMVDMINQSFWPMVFRTLDMASSTDVTKAGNMAAGITILVTNPLMFSMFLAAYIMLIVAVVNKCFAAIYLVPDRVLHWIGHQGEHSTAEQDMQSVKGGVSATSQKAAGGIKDTGAKIDAANKKQAEDNSKKGGSAT